MIRLLPFLLLFAVWEAAVRLLAVPRYLLPAPSAVLAVYGERGGLILEAAAVTALETVLGLAAGVSVGVLLALSLSLSPRLRLLVGPLLPAVQAIPVFAIAPLLVTWLGFGLAPKIVMAALIIFFPVAAVTFDALSRTDPALVDLLRQLGASRRDILFKARLPAALPALAASLRVAAALAPIGAVVGEWVGASQGLGALMLHANARTQTDVVFASLFCLAAFALALWAVTDYSSRRLVFWAPETLERQGLVPHSWKD